MPCLIRKVSGFIILFVCAACSTVFAQDENLNVLDEWIEWNNGGSMLLHHLNSCAFDLFDVRDAEIAGLKTRADWAGRQKKVRETLNRIVGPLS